ncbi:MAG: response regulator transcription factor [Anaerolineae bacterium]|nr:response regulator transcription factor [Anaerolineae bacterium]MCO5192353.1 response regulator transcription factor [Anaerolineae bacterium]MCO5199803.1 response regulator transcription factor [Anaerolineae bacterium]MCO5203833.1 response regulator transcription factor [Anaerolineae bacterium]
MTNAIRVLIVDDHMMVRDGLKLFLSNFDDIELAGEAANGTEAVAQCELVEPDVVLMDMIMPEMDGPTATNAIKATQPEIQIIALTSFDESNLVSRAIQAGAVGFLYKDVHADKLAQAIRDAHVGLPTIDSQAALSLVQTSQSGPQLGSDLTRREREVLRLLIEGMRNREIADALSISTATVRLHVGNILTKLDAANRTEAVSIALQHNLLD